jgi:hypothetical protein
MHDVPLVGCGTPSARGYMSRHRLTSHPSRYRARRGTQPVASLPRRSVAENGTTGTCVTLFATEMHETRLKTDAKSETVSSVNDTMKGTMITMALTSISPTDTIL